MEENYSDITDLNYLALTVPEDGTLAIVADGCATWAPGPASKSEMAMDVAMARDGSSEHWLPMLYEGVHSEDGKLIDVVAWQEDDPTLYGWRRTGRGIVLGAVELSRVSWTDLPCLLVSAPAGWRFYDRKNMAAVCILDMDNTDVGDLFAAHFGTIFCASAELERRFLARAAACGAKPITLVDDLLG